jgi:ATP-dependent DNA helicase 2 subunit 1
VLLAKAVVKTLRIRFNSVNFENPSLQKHYASLQAIALEREVEEDVEDYVKPDEEG